jgi:hypothetical protein
MDDLLLTPIGAARHWFPKRDGRSLSGKAVIRRIRKGQGGVRLQATLDGGQWFTTRRWVEEYLSARTAAALPVVPSPSVSERAVAHARAALARRFGRGAKRKAAHA